jgi:hypothetical protein
LSLSIEEYDRNEKEAMANVGYAQHAAYSTKTFKDHGFPTNMTEEREIFRYVDSIMGTDLERLNAGYFFRDTPIRTDYSLDEVELLNKISRGVENITEKSCDEKHSVFFNHLSGVGLFRIVSRIAELTGKEKLSVFEVGPGCGYTGALIGMLGHNYASYDVTQAYYLFQNRLMDNLFKDEFTEYAGANELPTENQGLSRISHLPWWKYMELFKDNPFKADIVISNANLAEMHSLSQKYMLRMSKMMMAESDIGMLIFGNVGSEHMGTEADVFQNLDDAGYKIIVKDQFFGFAPQDKTFDPQLVATLGQDIPNYDTMGLGKSFGARDFLRFDEDRLTEEYKFYSFLSDWPKL